MSQNELRWLQSGCQGLEPGVLSPHLWRLQIQKTSEALVNNGFVGLRTFECLLHYYELHTERLITDLDSVPDEREGGKGGHNKRRRDGSAPAAAAEAGKKAPVSEPQTVAVAKPCMEARGHTGYLLVARKAVPC